MPSSRQTLTFLFTDIEGSSRLWEQFPNTMGEAIEQHDSLLREMIELNGGHVFKTVGDATCAAFPTAQNAMEAAATAQRRIFETSWGEIGAIKVRMGLHTGAAEYRNNDYFGPVLNRVARISSSAHGGQTLLSKLTSDLLGDDLPTGISLRRLGELQLRNLSQPEIVYQAIIEGLLNDFPTLRAAARIPNNLPPQSTRFIGRTEASQQVRELIQNGRMLTLVGAGGSGKTRLAIEATGQMLETFRDGVWLIELVQVRELDRIWEVISAAVGTREEMDRPLDETVLDFLHSKSTLLILDNCEQLVPEVSRVATEILRHCPDVKLVTTSRQALGVTGERVFAVQSLRTFDTWSGDPHPVNSAEQMAQYDAIQLFVDRATAARPGFELTNENAWEIAVICFRLDGIPLAIELAAARARVLTVHQIAERLEDRFRLLRGNNQQVPHQQTLETLIEWSFDLLTPEEKTLIFRLSIFAGGRTLEAIEQVCSDETVDAFAILDLLDQLIAKSLVAVELDFEGQPRYIMSESVWRYARQKLETSPEAAELRQRHAEYFLEYAEKAAPELEGPNQKRWLDLLYASQINFRLIFSNLDQLKNGTEIGLRLLGALGAFAEIRGNVRYVRELGPKILARPDATDPSLDKPRADALYAAARIAWCVDENDEATHLYAEAETLYEKLGDREMAALSNALPGFGDRGNGDLESAEARFQRALETSHATKSICLEAIALSGLSSVAYDRGEISASRRLKQESLDLYRKIGDRWICSLILWGLADIALAQHDIDPAREMMRELIDNLNHLENRWLHPYILKSQARLQLAQDRPALAARLLGGEEALRKNYALRFTPREEAEYQKLVADVSAALPEAERVTNWQLGAKSPIHELLVEGLS